MNALAVHGGGPTAVLNASLAGLVQGCRPHFENLFGSRFGFDGILRGEVTRLFDTPDAEWERIANMPGSAIGSSRAPVDVAQIAKVLAAHRIDRVFVTGGNGTMEMALRLQEQGVDVVGIPKTIDNDLAVTHFSPGFPSTARFFANAARDIGMDVRALPSPICVLETLGRNSGWIVGATALARQDEWDAPQVILLPEQRRSVDDIAAEVERVYRRIGWVLVAVCEGQLDENGQPFGADVDRPEVDRHRLASNLGHTLAQALSKKLGLRARAERPGLLGRACSAVPGDKDAAYRCGVAGATAALGTMIALHGEGRTFETPLRTVAGVERKLPPEYIANASDYLRYLGPLMSSLPNR